MGPRTPAGLLLVRHEALLLGDGVHGLILVRVVVAAEQAHAGVVSSGDLRHFTEMERVLDVVGARPWTWRVAHRLIGEQARVLRILLESKGFAHNLKRDRRRLHRVTHSLHFGELVLREVDPSVVLYVLAVLNEVVVASVLTVGA